MKTLMAALTLFAFLGAASIPPAAYAQATGGSTDTMSKSKKGKTHKTKPSRPAAHAGWPFMYEYHRPTNRISQLENRSRPARLNPGRVVSRL